MTFKPDDLMYRPGLMDGERILITGASSGLGAGMARAFWRGLEGGWKGQNGRGAQSGAQRRVSCRRR